MGLLSSQHLLYPRITVRRVKQRDGVPERDLELPRLLLLTTEPHEKPQFRAPLKWRQMGLVCPVLVRAW